MSKVKKTLSLLLALALVFSLFPASVFAEGVEDPDPVEICTGTEDCVAETHEEGCPKYIAPVVTCTGGEDCTAETHSEVCAKYIAPVATCTGGEDCAAQTHNEGCPKYAAPVVICTKTEGCTLPDGHDGSCNAAPAAPAHDCEGQLEQFELDEGEMGWRCPGCGALFDAEGNELLVGSVLGDDIIVSGTCGGEGKGDNLTWELTKDGVLTIFGTGKMYSYSWEYNYYDDFETTAPWRGYKISAVVISDGVTSIGNYCFYHCKSLTSVIIPDSVTSIGNNTFNGCFNLTSANIPDSVISIGEEAFCGCSLLTSANIPDGVPYIGYRTFYGCSSLTGVEIPNSVTSIGDEAFYGCSSLASANIPNSVTSIGDKAFCGCSSLASVNIPNGITNIGINTFSGCSSLTCVSIPDTVTTIGDEAFYGCSSLTSVDIPINVTSIGRQAFSSCSSLTTLRFFGYVTSIGFSAFYGCRKLSSIYISDMAFWCDAMLASSLSNPYDLYLNDTLVTDLELSDSISVIKNKAFYKCRSLTSIIIPDSVTSIGNEAFSGCQKLTRVSIPSSVTDIGASSFNNCGSLVSINIPKGISTIGTKTFCACSSLTSIIIPDGVTSIGDMAFRDCSSLTTVNIPDSVIEIGTDAFGFCSSLTSVNVPDSLTNLGNFAFYCTGITKICFEHEPKASLTIGTQVFNVSTPTATTIWVSDTDRINPAIFNYDWPGDNRTVTYESDQSSCPIDGTFNGSSAQVDANGNLLINEVNFPDENFRSYISTQFDRENAGYLTKDQVSVVTGIQCSEKSICDLKGIEFFTALTSLLCQDNQLTSLDVSKNTALTELRCFNNQLEALDISKNEALNYLNCSSNELTSLAVSKNTQLSILGCSHNHIAVLELARNTALTTLSCSLQSTSAEAYWNNCELFLDLGSIVGAENLSGISNVTGGSYDSSTGIVALAAPEDGEMTVEVSYGYNTNAVVSPNTMSVTITVTIPEKALIASGACGDNIKWALDESGVLKISGSGQMPNYNDVTVFPPWHSYSDRVTSIVIAEGITTIESYAFSNCSNATSITIPDSVTTIDASFPGCRSLTSISIPASVERIHIGAFSDCDNLTLINIEDLSRWCTIWWGGSSTPINHPYTLTINGEPTTDLVVPSDVETIGEHAFENCSSIQSVTVPKSVTQIERIAFAGCCNLKVVTFEGNAPQLNKGIFETAQPFEGVLANAFHPKGDGTWSDEIRKGMGRNLIWHEIGDPSNPIPANACGPNATWAFDSETGILRISGYGQMTDFSYHGLPWESIVNEIKSVVIEPGITSIGNYAFNNCSNLIDISIPEGIETIGLNAFADCVNLTRVTLPKSLSQVGEGAFYCCNSLQEVNISDLSAWCRIDFPGHAANPAHITHKLLLNGKEITDLVVPEDICHLGSYTFQGCSNIKSIILSDRLSSIGEGAFSSCAAVPSVDLPDSLETLGEFAFSECDSLTDISLPKGIAEIGDYAFFHCSNLWDIRFEHLSEDQLSIGTGAFLVDQTTLTKIGVFNIEDVNPAISGYDWARDSRTVSFVAIPVQTLTFKEASVTVKLSKASYQNKLTHVGDGTLTYCSSNETVATVDNSGMITLLATGTTTITVTAAATTQYAQAEASYTLTVLDNSSHLDLTDNADLAGQTEVWIDGVAYPIETDDGHYVNLPETGTMLTTFSFKQGSSDGSHDNYPTGMEVYRIVRSENGATVEKVPELSNLLIYSGCSIRLTGKPGIRMITSMTQQAKAALIGAGLADYTLEEYGTVIAWKDALGGEALTLANGKSNYAYKRGVSDPVFANVGELTQYTNVLVWDSLEDAQYAQDIAMRPYIILSKDGETVTLYGGTIERSIGYVAQQNADTFPVGSAGYKYVHDIIDKVNGLTGGNE